MVAQRRCQFRQCLAGIGHHRQSAVLCPVIGLHVDRHQPPVGVAEQVPRAGGEILKPCADANHQIGLFGQRICTGCTGDTHRAEVHRMGCGQGGFARLGFHHGNLVLAGKGRQSIRRAGIQDTAPGDNQRCLSGADGGNGGGQFGAVGTGAADGPDPAVKERHRVIIGFGLGILTKRQYHRATACRIGHHRQRTRQSGQHMFGAADAVEIAADRAETVVG